jgi:hypothetical protein
MPATYDQIAYELVTSAKSTVTFSSIPQTYTDLVLVGYGSQAATDSVCFRVGNGTVDSGNNYSATWGGFTSTRTGGADYVGATVTSNRASNTNLAVLVGWQSSVSTTGVFSGETQIFNYSSTSSFKTFVGTEVNTDNTGGFLENHVTAWRNTAAINIIQFFNRNGNFAAGTSFSLYGIKGA